MSSQRKPTIATVRQTIVMPSAIISAPKKSRKRA
jgi:hypothetical protein